MNSHVGETAFVGGIRVAVQDNGHGIDDSFVNNVFTPFRKKHNSKEITGSGLGLAIAKKIAIQHQGKIGVTTAPGKGSTFFVDFPRQVVFNGDLRV